jgi:hypothetical protein
MGLPWIYPNLAMVIYSLVSHPLDTAISMAFSGLIKPSLTDVLLFLLVWGLVVTV